MATLSAVVNELRRHVPRSILVTGPQRAGTTIGGHIVAQELGYQYVDEWSIDVHSVEKAREFLLQDKVVVQAPALCSVADRLGCLVVIMRRDLSEIRASEERISWRSNEAGELAKYGLTAEHGQIADLKYRLFDALQKPYCVSFDLDYHTLAGHPLWVESQERVKFGPRQWQAGDS